MIVQCACMRMKTAGAGPEVEIEDLDMNVRGRVIILGYRQHHAPSSSTQMLFGSAAALLGVAPLASEVNGMPFPVPNGRWCR